MRVFSLLSLILTLFSCAQTEEDGEVFTITKESGVERVIFKKPIKEIKGEALGLKALGLGFISPNDIDVSADFILVTDSKTENLIQVFDRKSNAIVAKFDKLGEGPGELLRASFAEFIDDGQRIVAFDSDQDFVSFIEVNRLGDDDYEAIRLRVDSDIENPQYISDSLFVGMDGGGEYRLLFVNASGQVTKRTGSLPKTNGQKVHPYPLAGIYQARVEFAPKQELIFLSNRQTDRIECFSRSGEPLYEINGPLFAKPDFQVINLNGGTAAVPGDNMINGFLDIYVAENYFYVLYSGKTDKELPDEAHFGDQVYVFDYQGKPQEHFLLDRRVLRIAVDEKAGLLYASDFSKEDPKIVEYRIR